MNSCPKCKKPIDPTSSNLHNCRNSAQGEEPVYIADAAPAKADLEDAFNSWFGKGKTAMQAGQYEEAANCLREAIKRSRVLDRANEKEITCRKALAETLEKLNKLQESADQYRIIAQEVARVDLKEQWLKKSQDLVASSSSLPYELLFQKEEFRALIGDEAKTINLYCPGCKRLMAEAEVYNFRRGSAPFVKCWCGEEGIPLAKADNKHNKQAAEPIPAPSPSSQRTRAIAVASKDLPEGKKKTTAVLLALFTGWIGGHKFYLGETTAGFIYVVWFWTLIPLLISLYEAIVLMEMSITTFNMTYNIDLVLALVQPLDESRATKMEVFSMDPKDDGGLRSPTALAESGQTDIL